MNSRSADPQWTSQLLEQYHDGELDELQRAALSEALRESPELRERLAEVARLDSLAVRALAAPALVGRPAPGTRLVVRPVFAVALAACLALLVVPLLTHRERAPVSLPVTITGDLSSSDRERTPAVRVVLSIPAIPASSGKGPGVAAALERGDVTQAARVLAEADRSSRDAELRRLGELIRSASRADELLDSLSDTDQLAACRVWAEDPRLRPAAFARLERLRSRTDLVDQYRAVMTGFAERPELSAWVRSYLRPTLPVRSGVKSS